MNEIVKYMIKREDGGYVDSKRNFWCPKLRPYEVSAYSRLGTAKTVLTRIMHRYNRWCKVDPENAKNFTCDPNKFKIVPVRIVYEELIS